MDTSIFEDKDFYLVTSGNLNQAVVLATTMNAKRFSHYLKFISYRCYTYIPTYHTTHKDVFDYLGLLCQMLRMGYIVAETEHIYYRNT
jgi:hypothetical protein